MTAQPATGARDRLRLGRVARTWRAETRPFRNRAVGVSAGMGFDPSGKRIGLREGIGRGERVRGRVGLLRGGRERVRRDIRVEVTSGSYAGAAKGSGVAGAVYESNVTSGSCAGPRTDRVAGASESNVTSGSCAGAANGSGVAGAAYESNVTSGSSPGPRKDRAQRGL